MSQFNVHICFIITKTNLISFAAFLLFLSFSAYFCGNIQIAQRFNFYLCPLLTASHFIFSQTHLVCIMVCIQVSSAVYLIFSLHLLALHWAIHYIISSYHSHNVNLFIILECIFLCFLKTIRYPLFLCAVISIFKGWLCTRSFSLSHWVFFFLVFRVNDLTHSHQHCKLSMF